MGLNLDGINKTLGSKGFFKAISGKKFSFSDYAEGGGFSGAFNIKTGEFSILPSGSTKLKNGALPTDIVDQFGGHGQLGEKLAKLTGGSVDDMAGFTLVSQGKNAFEIRWNSASLNTRNGVGGAGGASNSLALEYRQNIINALQAAFKGYKFTSSP